MLGVHGVHGVDGGTRGRWGTRGPFCCIIICTFKVRSKSCNFVTHVNLGDDSEFVNI